MILTKCFLWIDKALLGHNNSLWYGLDFFESTCELPGGLKCSRGWHRPCAKAIQTSTQRPAMGIEGDSISAIPICTLYLNPCTYIIISLRYFMFLVSFKNKHHRCQAELVVQGGVLEFTSFQNKGQALCSNQNIPRTCIFSTPVSICHSLCKKASSRAALWIM